MMRDLHAAMNTNARYNQEFGRLDEIRGLVKEQCAMEGVGHVNHCEQRDDALHVIYERLSLGSEH